MSTWGCSLAPHHRSEGSHWWPAGPTRSIPRGRLPPGHLPGGAAGADAGGEHPAGALVRLPTGAARLLPGAGPVRHPADGGAGGGPGEPGEEAVLTSRAPVEGLQDYRTQVAAYTRGQGRLFCTPGGYRPCGDQAGVVSALGYDPEQDTDNPADSVFCSHGAGVTVKWDQVRPHACGQQPAPGREEAPPPGTPVRPAEQGPAGSLEQDKELMAIFERTYGKVEQRAFQPQKKPARTSLDGGSTASGHRSRGRVPSGGWIQCDLCMGGAGAAGPPGCGRRPGPWRISSPTIRASAGAGHPGL